LAPPTMKNAAKCDTSCDLQNPANHRNFERILRFRDIPGSMLVGVFVHPTRPCADPSPPRRRRRRRLLLLLGETAAAVAPTGKGWVLGRTMRRPVAAVALAVRVS